MAKKFSDLVAKMPAASQKRIAEGIAQAVKEMPLGKLRAARDLTQENLANVLHMRQGDISKIERRTDMYVSTLASYVKAMGGHLEIRAVFPDGEPVRVTQFEKIAKTKDRDAS